MDVDVPSNLYERTLHSLFTTSFTRLKEAMWIDLDEFFLQIVYTNMICIQHCHLRRCTLNIKWDDFITSNEVLFFAEEDDIASALNRSKFHWLGTDILCCIANITELIGRMSCRKMGWGGEQIHFVMSNDPEMPIIYFHFIPCWSSLFSVLKAPQ